MNPVTNTIRRKVSRLAKVGPYLRDLAEVLIVDRLRGTPDSRSHARDVAARVRLARFHAHASIRSLELEALVRGLAPEAESPILLPPPMKFRGVGNIEYYHALAAVVQATRPRRILEFGTYFGVGTLTMALNAPPDCSIVTIDLPDAEFGLHDLNSTDISLVGESRYRVGEAFVGSPVSGRIEQIRADSVAWQAEESIGPVDLVLIDGGHSASIVKADTENALRLLAPDGVILWDDYFYLYPEVVSYLDSLAAAGRQMATINGTNVVISSERLREVMAGR